VLICNPNCTDPLLFGCCLCQVAINVIPNCAEEGMGGQIHKEEQKEGGSSGCEKSEQNKQRQGQVHVWDSHDL